MRDEDYRREYLGEPYRYDKSVEEGNDDEYDVPNTITIRAITQIADCAICPNSMLCVTGKPLAETSSLAREHRTSFLCSRCACFHMWWPEQGMHLVCGLLRFGTHVSAKEALPSGFDHALVALWGPGAEKDTFYTADLHEGEAPCADFWNNYDLIVPMHPLTDGHPKYNDHQDRPRYLRCVDEYDCVDYFAGRVPQEFVGIPRDGRFKEQFEPISPFTVRRRIGRKIGTHGQRRMRGRYCL